MNKLSADQQNIIALTKGITNLIRKSVTPGTVSKEQGDADGAALLDMSGQLVANALIDVNRIANALEVIAIAVGPLTKLTAPSKGFPIIKP